MENMRTNRIIRIWMGEEIKKVRTSERMKVKEESRKTE
jgi:hypothetical protein